MVNLFCVFSSHTETYMLLYLVHCSVYVTFNPFSIYIEAHSFIPTCNIITYTIDTDFSFISNNPTHRNTISNMMIRTKTSIKGIMFGCFFHLSYRFLFWLANYMYFHPETTINIRYDAQRTKIPQQTAKKLILMSTISIFFILSSS